jgi:Flp pilus assembly protein TadG
MLRNWVSSQRRRRLSEAGYAAIMVALVVPTIGIACAAVAVDTGTWYVEMQMTQKAADAAALAGVPYLPQDFPNAKARALEVAKRNGFDNTGTNKVTVTVGEKPTQLKVTFSVTIKNTFGSAIGVNKATITRSGTADYQGPAPMGSPCNTFGNEPASGGGTNTDSPGNRPVGTAQGTSPFANCSREPQLWATVQGPGVDKKWGDRYQSLACASSSTYGCASSKNQEYDPYGYFFVVKILPGAQNQPIDLQIYDPAYINTGTRCGSLPSSGWTAGMNPYVGTDASTRYSSASDGSSPNQCPADHVSGGSGSDQVTTSFALREQTDSQNAKNAPIISGCVKQFAGRSAVPTVNSLKATSSSYDKQLAQVFHNWYTLCRFTPTRSGDYYLEVQTGVKPGGSAVSNTNGNAPIIYTGNSKVGTDDTDETKGDGDNSFAIRAVTSPGLEKLVAVSGFANMPIYINANDRTTTFNLIRVLPGAAGQYLSFSFYDIADGSIGTGGSVKVTTPTDATWPGSTGGAFPGGCMAVGGNAGSTPVNIGTTCEASVTNAKNDSQVETMSIPIPSTYTCNAAAQDGCWYKVTVKFQGANVSDITTWDATVVGDPVRLIK